MQCLRLLKLRGFTEPLRMVPMARILSGSILFCGQFLFPTLLLVLWLPFVFSLVILQYVSSYNASTDESLTLHWGSVVTAMASLLSTSCGGADWKVVGQSLERAGTIPYLLMFLHAIVFKFGIANVVLCGYLQSTLGLMHLNKRYKMHMQMENCDQYVASLRGIFLKDSVSFQDFAEAAKSPKTVRVFEELGVDLSDAHRLVFHLSAGGTKQVALSTFVRGAIMLNDAASKLDTLESQVNLELARRNITTSQKSVFDKNGSMLRSLGGKMPLRVMVCSEDVITKRLQSLCRVMPFQRDKVQRRVSGRDSWGRWALASLGMWMCTCVTLFHHA